MPAKKARPPTLALDTSRKPVTTTVIEFQTPVDLHDRKDDTTEEDTASSPSSSGSNSPLGYLDTDSDLNGDDLSRDLAVLEQLRRSVRKNLRLRPLKSTSSLRTNEPSTSSHSSADSPATSSPDLSEHRSSTPDSSISPESAYFTPLSAFKPPPLSAFGQSSDHLRRVSIDASARATQPLHDRQPPVVVASRGVSPALLLARLSTPTVPLLIDTRPVTEFLNSRLQRSVNMAIPSLILKRSKKAAGAFPSIHALRQYITTEEGMQTWDDLVSGDDWDGDVIVYDNVMEERDRNNSQSTAWSLLNVVAPLLQHGSADYLEGGLTAARRHPYLSQLLVSGSGAEEYAEPPLLEANIGSAPSSGKKAAGLSQLDTLTASRSKALPEVEQLAPSPQPLMPSAIQSWNVLDDYSTPSPPPSSTVFSRPQPPRRPSIPALRRLDTTSAERLKVPKLSVGPIHPPTKSATLSAPTGLRSRSRSPSHLNLVSSNYSPPGSARLLSPAASSTEFLPPPSPSHTQPSTPRTPGTPMPPSPMTARPDTDQPPTTEDPLPVFTVSTILPHFLFLGPDITAEEHVQELLNLGVKRILNLAIECDDNHGLRLRERFERYARIPMRDTVEEDNITRGVREACAILDDARLHSAPTYVHCKAGKSRSVTAVMAYLIHANHWTLSRAYAFVVGRRKGISPNIGFVSELMTFEEQELGGKSVGVVKMTPTHDSSDPNEPSDGGDNGGGAVMSGNYQVAVGSRRPQHIRESLPPAFTSQNSFNLVPTVVDAATLGDSQQELEIKDAEGRYRHARRAPVNEATLQPMRRVSKAGLESSAYV